MLYNLFILILNMAVTACPVIIIVLFVRGIMYRLPKKYRYIIWLVVGIRLICPVAVSSRISLFNIIDTSFIGTGVNKTNIISYYRQPGSQFSSNNTDSKVQEDNTGITVKQDGKENINIQPGKGISGNISGSENNTQTAESKKQINPVVKYSTFIWLAGIVFIVLWNFYMLFVMKRHLERAVRLKDNIYECENIPSPFVIGIWHPRIYIPFQLRKEEQEYILKHEKYHIKRRDYIIKPVAFLMVCIYWFNPLVWLSYFLMVRDMEMSCDEYVLQDMGTGICKDYSMSLLGFATNKRRKTAGLLSFGETDTRKRVLNVLNFKKHGKWIGFFAVILIMASGAVCLTNAYDKEDIKNNGKKIEENKNSGKVEGEDNKEYGDIVANETINGYNVQIVHIADSNTSVVDGYYSGKFVIRTYKENVKYAEYMLDFGNQDIYYPKEGFSLAVKDYDGDSNKDDFVLGQGQTAVPMLGNFMNYQVFTIDDDGSIVRYALSTEDGKNIYTIPGEYSPAFKCKNGEIIYQGLTEEGVKKQYANVVRIIPVNDTRADAQPMRSLMEAVENTMPGYVVDELHKKGFWRLSSDGYLLGNGKSNNDITLRLDFSFSGDKLVQYISKEYGFVDSMPDDRINKNQAKELVAEFERVFLSRKVNKNNIEIYNGYNTYKEKDYAAFIDEYGNTFLVHLLKNMVIKYDAGEKLLEPGQKQNREFYFEDIDVTIKLPENENWIQNPMASAGKDSGIVTYYDCITETEVKLDFGKKPQKDIEKWSGSVPYENEYWSFFGGKEKLIKVQFYKLYKRKAITTTLLSWKYNKIYFYMYTDFIDMSNGETNNLEWQVLAKTAAYIAENLCSLPASDN